MQAFFLSILVIGLITIFSCWLTYLVKNYTIKQSILDIPNERSSHSVDTPVGGGLAIVVTYAISLVFLVAFRLVPLNVVTALSVGGFAIAVTGWLDDKNTVNPGLRLVVHFIAACWALYWLGGISIIDFGVTKVQLGWLGNVLGAVGIVWLINLYNFMDGIDGIAGIEAISVALCAGFLLLWSGSSGFAWLCLILAAAVIGFLIWNWPPAKIFMGDVGSGFLGYTFAVLAITSEKSTAVPIIIWVLLLGVFIIDATLTLLKRMVGGEKIYQAHRKHLYQLAVRVGYSHKQVTLTVLVLNTLLAGLAGVAVQYRELLLFTSLGSMALLIAIYFVLTTRYNKKLNADLAEVVLQPKHLTLDANKEAAAMIELDQECP